MASYHAGTDWESQSITGQPGKPTILTGSSLSVEMGADGCFVGDYIPIPAGKFQRPFSPP